MKQINRLLQRGAILLLAMVVSGLVIPVNGAGEEGGTKDALKRKAVEKRDPFWPIDYRPTHSSGIVSQVATSGGVRNSWNEAMKQVVINGVSSRSGSENFAVINGDVKRVGDTVSVRMGTAVYTWVVDEIKNQGSVQLRRLSVQ